METIKINRRVWRMISASFSMIGCLLFTSCSDYLDVEPTNSIRTNTFYSTESQIDRALTGLYGNLKPLPQYMFTMSEMRSDNIWITADVKQNDYVDIATFNANGLLTDNIVKNCWAAYYACVAAANTLLDKIENVEFEDNAVKEQYKAEARFIRALAYFDLVRFFGNIPAATHALTTEEAFSLQQSPAKDIYEQIIVPDLQFAVGNLAETAVDFLGATHSERVTKIAAQALLGKVYLTMAGFPINQTEKKAEAATLLKAVIDAAAVNGKYWASTIEDWNHMWIHENDNKFFIFEIQYIAEKNEGNPMVCLSVPSNPGTDWCARSLVTGTHVYIEKGLQNHFIERNDTTNEYIDRRIGGTMNIRTSKGEDNEDFTPTGNTFYVKFFENKLKRAELGYTDMDATIVDRSYWPQNYPVIRLEDVMLLYAECVGTTEEGYEMVNKIRRRAGLEEIDELSADEFQEAVANERRYELAEEGHRWFDLVRQNKYVETLKNMFINDDNTVNGTYAAFASRVTADMYLYPIPQSQIEVREGLYQQNPGY
ncbi:MAG: RagB/SusD family nutrient uptake outer membrane protein [Bacteroidaceae bacterium]|nr:RagB/SusD family nutrient uptake outer membrane protein [Prevotella sp.]MBR1542833.1 RagB/SusD family nutrient uptake outer membrane protein [Bacteroidaceae bacterium]